MPQCVRLELHATYKVAAGPTMFWPAHPMPPGLARDWISPRDWPRDWISSIWYHQGMIWLCFTYALAHLFWSVEAPAAAAQLQLLLPLLCCSCSVAAAAMRQRISVFCTPRVTAVAAVGIVQALLERALELGPFTENNGSRLNVDPRPPKILILSGGRPSTPFLEF